MTNTNSSNNSQKQVFIASPNNITGNNNVTSGVNIDFNKNKNTTILGNTSSHKRTSTSPNATSETPASGFSASTANNNSQVAFMSMREPIQSSQIQVAAAASGSIFVFPSYSITSFVYDPRRGEPIPDYAGTVKACLSPGSGVKDGHEYDNRANACDQSTTSPPRPFPIIEIDGVKYKDTHINPVPVTTDSNGEVHFTVYPPVSSTDGIGIAGQDVIITQYPGAVCESGCPLTHNNKINLQQMYNSASCLGTTEYLFQRQKNHACDFYGTAKVNEALVRIAHKYVVRQQECINYIANPTNPPTDPNPCNIKHEPSPGNIKDYTLYLTGAPRKMEISAMSGPWGGLLDIGPSTGQFWNPPHKTYNNGKNVDIAFGGPPTGLSPYQESGRSDDALKLLRSIIKEDPLWSAFGKSNEGINMSVCATQTCNHYHVIFRDVPISVPLKTAVLTLNPIPVTGGSKSITISGSLKDATTNTGLAGRTITFSSTTGTTTTPASVTTNAAGAFTTSATTVSNGRTYYAQAQFASGTDYDKATAIRSFVVDTIDPTISITSPANGATLSPAPKPSITITATATDKLLSTSTTNDGKIAKVSFYYKSSTSANLVFIGTDTTAPYSVTWSNVPAGSYSLLANAADAAGNVKQSTPTSITVK
jgi:hypothetical protein